MHPFDLPTPAGTGAALPAGTWSLDLRSLELHWSAQAAAIHGLPELRTPGLWRALDCMEPLDRAQFIATVLHSLRRDGVFEGDVRITTAQGVRKLVRMFGHVDTDASGLPIALHGLIEDLHDERARQEGEVRLAQLLSHELRAHVRTLDSHSVALERTDGPSLSAGGMQSLARMRLTGSRIERVVEAVAQLGSECPLRREQADLSGMAQQILDELRQRHPERQAEITVQPGIRITADPGLVALLLEALLSNAWKFSAPRPVASVRVDAVQAGSDLVVRIADNGIGFAAQEAARIFRLFTRLPEAADFPGSGVGLALAGRIVQRHQGVVWAHGEPGRGATFFFRL